MSGASRHFDNLHLPAASARALPSAGPMHLDRSRHPSSLLTLVAALAALGLAGCATTAAAPVTAAAGSGVATAAAAPSAAAPATRPAANAASGAAPVTTPAAPPAAGQPPPFATVIKDAKEIKGLFTLWQKDEKVWIELKPEDFNKPFFFAPKLARGLGEGGIFGGSMRVPGSRVDDRIVEFRRQHNLVQLVAVNNEFIARGDGKSPEARAVAAAFAPSLLSSATLSSSPHPERKTVLVDAGALFLNDMLGIGAALQRAYRQGYSLEGRNTQFTQVRGKPDQVVFDIDAHYFTANLAVPQPGAPPGVPQPTVPRTLPDPRSMILGLHIAIGKLPETPMVPRVADARVGYFSTTVQDFGDDLARSPRQRYVNRWRLEKKDPAAALSEPVKPITFWLDRTIPLKYRDAISKGVLGWNAAFERVGFKDAVVVKVQPDDADFDTLDTDAASIRWMTNAQPSFGAIGPSQVDPRSGEILDADIAIESLSSRSVRTVRSQILSGSTDWPALMQSPEAHAGEPLARHAHGAQCQHADFAAEQLGYALDVLEARGELDPASAEAQQFVLDYLTDVTMHEVGHTLGLRHNFRSSRIYTDKQLSDPQFTAANGLAGSVMEYAPINLPLPGRSGGTPFQTALGPYDFWAIEYAYRPMVPEQEAAELQRIASRSAEPALAYGSDEDNFLGIDAESLTFDLGDDPVAFAAKRIEIARDVIARQETRVLKPDTDYSVLRRSVNYAVRDAGRAAGILARQIGGVRTLRDHPGSGRDPLLPVPAAVQRQALDVLASGVLAADSFKLSPAMQRRLAPDFSERGEALFGGEGAVTTDFSIIDIVLGMQRALLAQLMSDGVATRLLDSEGKVDLRAGSADAFRLSELYTRLTREIWSELGKSGDIAAPRRELQREHTNRLATMLLRPTASSRADARSLLRVEAQGLLARINGASKRAGLSAEARAHLADSADTLTQALQAKLQRAGV
jgi:Met-zincin/Domain of unknown function (DUF5117)/Domain of unknown function (DUF5118)